MKTLTNKFLFLLGLSIILLSCSESGEKKAVPSKAPAKPEVSINYPAFSADTAYAMVTRQVDFGPRVPNTRAHRACGDFLTTRLRELCDTVYIQEMTIRAWDGTPLKLRNIIGSFRPKEIHRMFVSSHWDSRPYADNEEDPTAHNQPIDGANDGASGVGVILELARVLNQNPPPNGVDLILFDGEDYGEPKGKETGSYDYWTLGSTYWSHNPHIQGYRARFGILLDMVGIKDARFPMEGTSLYFAPDILAKVWSTAAKAGYGNYFVKEKAGAIIDDHLPVNEIAHIPTIDIIHLEQSSGSGFFRHWHTRADNLESVDPTTLGVVGTVMVRVIYDGI